MKLYLIVYKINDTSRARAQRAYKIAPDTKKLALSSKNRNNKYSGENYLTRSSLLQPEDRLSRNNNKAQRSAPPIEVEKLIAQVAQLAPLCAQLFAYIYSRSRKVSRWRYAARLDVNTVHDIISGDTSRTSADPCGPE